MAALVGISENYMGQAFPLETEDVSVGRKEHNQIVISDSSVSGNHAQILKKDSDWLLRDLGSTNGTRVNGLTVGETRLQERDQVQFGSIGFVFTLGSPDDIDPAEITQQLDVPDIEVTAELAVKPDTFSSHSPFAAQKKERKGLWNLLLVIVGMLALLGVAALFFILFFTE